MSYGNPAPHHKPKQVGVPPHQVYTRHNTPPRHQPQAGYRQPPQNRDARQYTNQPPRHPSPIPGQPQGPGLPGHPSPSASPSGSVPQQPPTALATGAPHDMNKQGAPNRPALTPSPVQQGTILQGQPMLINPQQIMYASQNMTQRGQVTYITNQRTNPRSGIPMSNMQSQSQQGGQPQASYQTNPQMTMTAPPFIPSSHHTAPPPHAPQQYMMQQPMMMSQSNLYTPRQQIPIQYQQTAVFQQPNTPPFYQGSPPVSAHAGGFFPQNQQQQQQILTQQQPQQQQQLRPPQMTVQQTATTSRLPAKERKIIRIVDPTSNTDITDSIMREGTSSSTGTTPTHSGRSSASSTPPAVSTVASGQPPPTQQTQQTDKARAIQASFAAQVALAAADNRPPPQPPAAMVNLGNNSQPGMQQPPIPQGVPPPSHQPIPVRIVPQSGPVVVQPPQGPAAPSVVQPPQQQTVIIDNSNKPAGVPREKPPTTSVQIRPAAVAFVPAMSAPVFVPAPAAPSFVPAPTTVVTSQRTPAVTAAVLAPAVPKQTEEDSEKKAPKEESDSTSLVADDKPEESIAVSEPVVEQQETTTASEKVVEQSDSVSKSQEDVEPLKEDTSVKEETVTETLPVVEKPLPKEEPASETAKQEPVVEKTVPQEETVEKATKETTATVPQKETAPEAKQAPVKENSKKKNQKNRLKELDKKSTKDDMFDAYKDKVEESTPAAPTAAAEKKEVKKEEVVTPEVEKPQQQAVPEKAPTTTTTATEEKKTELPKPETKPEPKAEVESDKLSEKEVPKVEVSVVDSVDKKEREMVEAENAKNKETMEENEDGDTTTPKDNKIQLKYTYRDDTQWSPVNPEGKKQYGRDFLLQFQPECKDKPDGLPHIPDIVLDKADIRPISGVADPRMAVTRGGGGGGGNRGGGGGGIDFMPDYMRSPRGSGGPPQFPQGGGGRRSSREPKKVIARASQGPEASLKKADNAWKPGNKVETKKALTEEEAKTADLIKSFKSILNKLTPQNFQKLMAKTLELPIDNEERLTAIIDLVFEKAITESAFSKAYANMCRVLSQIKVPSANGTGNVQFRTILINRCQRAFESEKAENDVILEMKKKIDAMEDATEKQKENDELFILQVKAKQKVLGNMRFIGELYKLRMLTENIMHDCILKLLRAKDDDSLECMTQLMTTVGKDLDHERAKNRMDQYFTQMAKIIANRKTPARIRFMLQDVEDLRKCHWVPRRDDNAPKTIAQIHQDAKQEEAAKKIEAQMAIHSHSSKSREGNRSSKGGRPPPQPSSNDDWQTVSVNKGRPQIDPSKLINLGRNRQSDNDNVQLGPGGRPGSFGSWGRGSSGGGTTKMQSNNSTDLRPQTGNNRYAMLSDQGRGGAGGARPGMAPPTRDSKGRPTGSMPSSSRGSRERDQGSRGGSREDHRGKERRQLLDEVSRMSSGSGARSRSIEKERGPSRERGGGGKSSREGRNRDGSSRERRGSRDTGSRDRGSRERAPPSATAGKSSKPQLSDEEFEKKGKATLDEYLNIKDEKEACTCISELNSPDRMHIFVRVSIEHVLEMKGKARLSAGVLFHQLMKAKLLSVSQYLQGLNEVLEFAEDMAIDIPLIWQYLGEIMGSMIQDKTQSLDYLGKALESVKASRKAHVLLAEVLRTAEKNIGAEVLTVLWQSSGFTWQQFLPEGEQVAEFVHKMKLEYTLQKTSSMDPLVMMTTELGFMLARKDSDNNNIFDWIEKNVDGEQRKQKDFIRALVTVVCQSTMEGNSGRCDPDLLKIRAKCLLRYIDGDVAKELQALFAVQALNHKLVNPPGFLRLIFDVLYDEDVISEDTFYAWQNSSDPAEQAGKGVAIKSVTRFFAWLGEAEDDGGN